MKFNARRQRRELAAAIDRGRKLHVSGHPEETFEFLDEAVRQFPDDPEIRLLYASTLLVFGPRMLLPRLPKPSSSALGTRLFWYARGTC
jgi:hypothetical protein